MGYCKNAVLISINLDKWVSVSLSDDVLNFPSIIFMMSQSTLLFHISYILFPCFAEGHLLSSISWGRLVQGNGPF